MALPTDTHAFFWRNRVFFYQKFPQALWGFVRNTRRNITVLAWNIDARIFALVSFAQYGLEIYAASWKKIFIFWSVLYSVTGVDGTIYSSKSWNGTHENVFSHQCVNLEIAEFSPDILRILFSGNFLISRVNSVFGYHFLGTLEWRKYAHMGSRNSHGVYAVTRPSDYFEKKYAFCSESKKTRFWNEKYISLARRYYQVPRKLFSDSHRKRGQFCFFGNEYPQWNDSANISFLYVLLDSDDGSRDDCHFYSQWTWGPRMKSGSGFVNISSHWNRTFARGRFPSVGDALR